MRLILLPPVLLVVLSMVLEGPALAWAAPDLSNTCGHILDKLKEFGNTLEEKGLESTESIKQSDIGNVDQLFHLQDDWGQGPVSFMRRVLRKPSCCQCGHVSKLYHSQGDASLMGFPEEIELLSV
ncbi:LOW QUALITY PROTEIN: apolipoprotein C-I-like [Prionailurus bengalensis]|uniref:LOW QUALITY PROTEIN: apolipoprotein C-I-like n=1 Tax=Prionailurus bengalensis TaxID=37029 RepID=UPI001CAA0EBA|nr:LOW QUALITY PROTEIN: apolipoprotein C-I-like [Prionailurus bengalensis]